MFQQVKSITTLPKWCLTNFRSTFATSKRFSFEFTRQHKILCTLLFIVLAISMVTVYQRTTTPFSDTTYKTSVSNQIMGANTNSSWTEAAPAPNFEKLQGTDNTLLNHERQKAWVTAWISKRYKVAGEAVEMFVSAAYVTAHEIELDPLLILAVMAVESRFNPFAESPVGAQGLMQVMSKVHADKFEQMGGIETALDPVTNIKVGSMILKEYVKRGGSVEKGLKSYVGAAAHSSDAGYGAKVLSEYRHLKAVASGKKISVAVKNSAAQQPPKVKKQAEPLGNDVRMNDNPALTS